MGRGVAIVVVGVVVACGCRNADDAARAGVRVLTNADQQLDDASQLGRRLPGLLDDVSVPAPARSSVDNAVKAIPVDNETTREALRSLGWDVFCDVVTGEVPRDRQQLAGWIESKAAAFGVRFFGSDGLNRLVDGVLAASDNDPNASTAACARLPESGL